MNEPMNETVSTNAPVSPEDDLVGAPNERLRARRAPSSILLLWIFQSTLAALATFPMLSLVGAAFGGHPRGDAPLYEPGSLSLVNFLLNSKDMVRPLTGLPILCTLTAIVVGLFPLSAMLHQINHETASRKRARLRWVLTRALLSVPALTTLLAIFLPLEAAGAMISLGLGKGFASATESFLGEARAEQLGFLLGLTSFASVAVLGIFHDLARAAIVRFRVPIARALKMSWNAFRRAPGGVLWAWVWRATLGLGLVLGGAFVAEKAAGAWATLLVFCTHQAILVVRAALRASGLAFGLRAIDSAHRLVPRTAASEAPSRA